MHVLVNQSVPSAVLMQPCIDISMVQAILRLPEQQSLAVIRVSQNGWVSTDQREKLAEKILASKIQKTKDSRIEKILDARTFFFFYKEVIF